MTDYPLTRPLSEAAAKIGCSERWLADRLRDGTFAAHKIAGHWRFTPGDIDAIIEATATTQVQRPPQVSTPPPAFTLTEGSRRAVERERRRRARS